MWPDPYTRVIGVLWLAAGVAIIAYSAFDIVALTEGGYQGLLSGKLALVYGVSLIAAALAFAAGVGLLIAPRMTRMIQVAAIAFALYAFIYFIGWEEGHWAFRVVLPVATITLCIGTLTSIRRQA